MSNELTPRQKAALLLIDLCYTLWEARKIAGGHTALNAYRAGYLQGQHDLINSLYPEGLGATLCDKKS